MRGATKEGERARGSKVRTKFLLQMTKSILFFCINGI